MKRRVHPRRSGYSRLAPVSLRPRVPVSPAGTPGDSGGHGPPCQVRPRSPARARPAAPRSPEPRLEKATEKCLLISRPGRQIFAECLSGRVSGGSSRGGDGAGGSERHKLIQYPRWLLRGVCQGHSKESAKTLQGKKVRMRERESTSVTSLSLLIYLTS